jgi:carbon-monoxide dehydrogenase small subunit
MHRIRLRINGKEYEAEVEARLLLVHFLRDKLHLTGTHVGCDTGNCGACTVSLNDKTVKSCNMLAVQADGGDLITIEGVATGALDPIQEAFLSALGLLRETPRPTEADIREAIEGNICMCTGYQQIVDAISHAAAQLSQVRE